LNRVVFTILMVSWLWCLSFSIPTTNFAYIFLYFVVYLGVCLPVVANRRCRHTCCLWLWLQWSRNISLFFVIEVSDPCCVITVWYYTVQCVRNVQSKCSHA
jgi:hypothetical protein